MTQQPYYPPNQDQPWNPYNGQQAMPQQAPFQQQQQQPAQNPFQSPQQGAAPMGNPFQKVAPVVLGDHYPSAANLMGRLLGFWVVGFNPNVASQFKNQDGSTVYQDQVIAHTVVLDGEPMTHKLDGRTRMPKGPFPFPYTAPIEFEGMTWSQKVMVSTLKPHLNGAPQLGRLIFGTPNGSNNPPVKLELPTDADMDLAFRYVQQREQIKAQWAAKFAAADDQPGQYAGLQMNQQQGSPFTGPGPQQFQPQQQFQGQPAYGTPPQQFQQQAPVQQQFHEPLQAYNPEQPAQLQAPAGWNPEPQGPPPGWPGAQQ